MNSVGTDSRAARERGAPKAYRMGSRCQRRGVMLTITVIVLTITVGMLTALTFYAVEQQRLRQAGRVRQVSHALLASSTAYVEAHRGEWAASRPAGPVVLDVRDLLPPKVEGNATVSFHERQGRPVCVVEAKAEWGPYAFPQSAEVPLQATTTQPG